MLSEEEGNANIERLLEHWHRDPADAPVAHTSATVVPRQLCLPGFRDRARVEPSVHPRIARWVLRVLARTNVLEHYFGRMGRLPAVDRLLGTDGAVRSLDPVALRCLVGMRLEEAEADGAGAEGPLQRNITMLAQALRLSPLECELLELRTQYWTHSLLNELFERVLDGTWSDEELVRIFAVAFDVEPEQAWWLLDRERPLFQSGLISLGTTVNGTFTAKLQIQLGLSNALQRPVRDLQELLSFAVRPTPPATLDCSDFPHLVSEIRVVKDLLQAASRDRTHGVNVLIHGPPGVGKTELSRAVPAASGLRAFQVGAECRDGDHLDIAERLGQYRMTQALLGNAEGTVVILDDIDNAFSDKPVRPEHPKLPKAWLNQLLESNPLPAVWIANDIRHIDPAYVRRFDVVLEVKAPPRSIRRKILRGCLGALPVGEDWIDRQADDAEVSPAVAARAARVLHSVDNPDPARLQAAYAMVVRGHLRATGARLGRTAPPRIEDYRPEWLNVDADVPRLLESLRRRPRGRLLFHGAPGTGKTALAHHIARTVDRPLLIKRASDLVSMWLGETEKNLSAMFEEAAADDAVLLLDEADSFLQDRGLAVRSWEVTEVNELLTRMEGFDGLFICATNFLERLDTAALRRFGLKLGFKPLRPEQAMSLFAATYRRLADRDAAAAQVASIERELARLVKLTPGDFAAAAARSELLDRTPTPEELLDALRKECALKSGGAHAIGF